MYFFYNKSSILEIAVAVMAFGQSNILAFIKRYENINVSITGTVKLPVIY